MCKIIQAPRATDTCHVRAVAQQAQHKCFCHGKPKPASHVFNAGQHCAACVQVYCNLQLLVQLYNATLCPSFCSHLIAVCAALLPASRASISLQQMLTSASGWLRPCTNSGTPPPATRECLPSCPCRSSAKACGASQQ